MYIHPLITPVLTHMDQLRQVMDTNTVFAGYEEGPLLFRPTYRYDFGTDVYDSSEKMRIPAWTGAFTLVLNTTYSFITDRLIDRILYRGNALDLAIYSRSELRGSDHKPGVFCALAFNYSLLKPRSVFAIFRVEVRIIDPIKKAALSRILIENVISTGPGEKLDEKLAKLTLPEDVDGRMWYYPRMFIS